MEKLENAKDDDAAAAGVVDSKVHQSWDGAALVGAKWGVDGSAACCKGAGVVVRMDRRDTPPVEWVSTRPEGNHAGCKAGAGVAGEAGVAAGAAAGAAAGRRDALGGDTWEPWAA